MCKMVLDFLPHTIPKNLIPTYIFFALFYWFFKFQASIISTLLIGHILFIKRFKQYIKKRTLTKDTFTFTTNELIQSTSLSFLMFEGDHLQKLFYWFQNRLPEIPFRYRKLNFA